MGNFTGYITIKNLCQVGWENMSTSEKGKFCSTCKKHVHDFTKSTAEEIKTAYIENKGNLCGHISAKLLREEYVKSEVNKIYLGHLKTFCLAAIICFGVHLFTVNKADANTLQTIKKRFSTISSKVENDSISIKGSVISKTDRSKLSFAIVAAYQNHRLLSKVKTK